MTGTELVRCPTGSYFPNTTSSNITKTLILNPLICTSLSSMPQQTR